MIRYIPSFAAEPLSQAKRGQHLVVYDAFPQFFKDMSKTHEQMVAAGLLEKQN
jgi:hypothetical protein